MATLKKEPHYRMVNVNSLVFCECCGERMQEYEVSHDGRVLVNVCEECSYLFFAGDSRDVITPCTYL